MPVPPMGSSSLVIAPTVCLVEKIMKGKKNELDICKDDPVQA
jgi:hypothetical protein